MQCGTIKEFLKRFDNDKKYINEIYYKKGNYEYYYYQGITKHYYYGNVICYVDWDKKEFTLHHCGYCPSTYTTTQLNYLEKYYKDLGCELKYRGY